VAALFHVNIIAPNQSVYEADISSLVVPAEHGYLGVLAHHAPIIAELRPGAITLRDVNGTIKKFILETSGLLEVSDNHATLLLDSLKTLS
jgi:F-type H+-transporting ATPase subunit epsilon